MKTNDQKQPENSFNRHIIQTFRTGPDGSILCAEILNHYGNSGWFYLLHQVTSKEGKKYKEMNSSHWDVFRRQKYNVKRHYYEHDQHEDQSPKQFFW